jgi:hypothetical protein
MEKKVVQLPGTVPSETIFEAVKRMAKELPSMIEYHKMKAVMQRHYYLELKAQGFDEKQALELCSKM